MRVAIITVIIDKEHLFKLMNQTNLEIINIPDYLITIHCKDKNDASKFEEFNDYVNNEYDISGIKYIFFEIGKHSENEFNKKMNL